MLDVTGTCDRTDAEASINVAALAIALPLRNIPAVSFVRDGKGIVVESRRTSFHYKRHWTEFRQPAENPV